jgi:hypothetical protein
MTDKQINAAIARALNADEHWMIQKDYCTDLNAMHEAEKVLTDEQCVFIRLHLRERLENHPASRYAWNATARQRAEAFLRTVGKWEEVQG